MSKELVQGLLEAGVHFGHQTKKWNPKMKPYIFGEKNGIHIVDLEKTMSHLTRACNFIRDIASQGVPILLVGTKPQAQSIIEAEAKRCGMYYVNHRWLGGMLTNYDTIRNSVRRYKGLILMREDGTFEALTKKEVAELEKEIAKLEIDKIKAVSAKIAGKNKNLKTAWAIRKKIAQASTLIREKQLIAKLTERRK